MDVNADTVQFAEDLQGFYLSKNTWEKALSALDRV